MQHPFRTGSAFRNKVAKEPVAKDIEGPLLNSGLLGRTPQKHRINYAKPPPSEPKANIDICIPSSRSGNNSSRAKTAFSKTPNTPRSARRPKTPNSAKQPQEIILKPQDTIDGPSIFYGRVLTPTEPPTSVNFIQLNELLDRLMDQKEEKDLTSDQIYTRTFGEVIRQYFIECQAQGDLLEACREFFSEAKLKIPNIDAHYDNIIKSFQKRIKDLRDEMKPIGPQLEASEKHRVHLQNVIAELKEDLNNLTSKHDILMRNLSNAFKELDDMKQKMNQLDTKIAIKNAKLMDVIEQLRALDSIAASYTTDTLRFASNLRAIREQQNEASGLISDANDTVYKITKDISIMDREIEILTGALEKSRMKPVVTEMGVQTDLVSRRLFKVKPKEQKIEDVEEKTAEEICGNIIQKIRVEYAIAVGHPATTDKISFNSYEEYAKFKKILIAHENEFRISNDLIENSQMGNFTIDKCSEDMIRLYACTITKSVVDRAIRLPCVKHSFAQTLIPQSTFKHEVSNADKIRSNSRFLSMVASDYSERHARPFDWLVKTIREIFNDKAIADDECLKEGQEFIRFPEYIIQYAKKKFNLPFLADQFCWDIYITSNDHNGRSPEVDCFIEFMKERYNSEQLAFFLAIRSDCMKVGSSVTIFTRDQLETYNEYYLSSEQLEQNIVIWWHKRYKKRYFEEIMDQSVPRPAIHLESTKRYVSMINILVKNLEFYAQDTIERLHELLLQYRITPRLIPSQFDTLMKALIPVLTKDQLTEYYRATVTKAKARSNATLEEFIQKFYDSSILVSREPEFMKEIAGQEEMHRAVASTWNSIKDDMMKIFDFFQSRVALQPDNLTMKMYFDDTTRYLSNFIHSLSIGDGLLSSQQLMQLLFSLDILFSTLNTLDTQAYVGTLISIECCIRENWLENAISSLQ